MSFTPGAEVLPRDVLHDKARRGLGDGKVQDGHDAFMVPSIPQGGERGRLSVQPS